MTISSKKSFFNKRMEPRFPYTGFVFFVYQKVLNKARLENWSRSGLCMRTNGYFRRGETVTLSLPRSKYKNHKRKAKIVWKNAERCGVEFCD
jgi:hypothetical protein